MLGAPMLAVAQRSCGAESLGTVGGGVAGAVAGLGIGRGAAAGSAALCGGFTARVRRRRRGAPARGTVAGGGHGLRARRGAKQRQRRRPLEPPATTTRPSPEVTAPASRHRVPGIRLHRSHSLDAQDTTNHQGIPTTTVHRTLLDIAAQVPTTTSSGRSRRPNACSSTTIERSRASSSEATAHRGTRRLATAIRVTRTPGAWRAARRGRESSPREGSGTGGDPRGARVLPNARHGWTRQHREQERRSPFPSVSFRDHKRRTPAAAHRRSADLAQKRDDPRTAADCITATPAPTAPPAPRGTPRARPASIE